MRIPSKAAVQKIFVEVSKVPEGAIHVMKLSVLDNLRVCSLLALKSGDLV